MTTNITSIFREDTVNNSNYKITKILSKYTEKKVNKDKSVTYTEIPTTYFLANDKWNIAFTFNNENINKEMKFIVYNKLFSDEWSLQAVTITQMQFIRR